MTAFSCEKTENEKSSNKLVKMVKIEPEGGSWSVTSEYEYDSEQRIKKVTSIDATDDCSVTTFEYLGNVITENQRTIKHYTSGGADTLEQIRQYYFDDNDHVYRIHREDDDFSMTDHQSEYSYTYDGNGYLTDADGDSLYVKDGNYYIVIIPIALINDLCNHELIKDFSDVENYHFILSASDNILRQRIENQEDRDADLALTYMRTAILYLNSHYSDAIRIDTSNMDVDSVATKIVEIIK